MDGPMNPEDFQSFVASGRLTQNQVKKLTSLLPGTFCLHRSWGFGKIVSFDLMLGQILIDFPQKAQHPMQLAYAADSLVNIPADHILAAKASNLSALKEKADENPAEVVRLFATSFGETALVERLESVLKGDVVSQDQWSKWLSAAKRACKKDGRISWPTRKNEPIRALEKPETASDSLRAELVKVRTLPELLAIAEDLLKKVSKASDLKILVPEIVSALDEHIRVNGDKNPSIVLEAIWIRDDLLKLGEANNATPNKIQDLVKEVHDVQRLVSDLSSHRQRHILPIIKQSFPDWEQRIKALIHNSGGKLLTEIVDFLTSEGKENELEEIFRRSLSEHKAGPDLILWLCKNRDLPAYAKWLPPLINGRLLSIILHQLEAIALEAGVRRKNPLSDFLLGDQTLIADLIRECDAEEARDLGKAVLLNPAIEELDKRSLMARLIKVSPSVQALLVSNQQAKSESLIVSWESLERRKNEYEEIINKKIPENSKEIALARSYGDLRENHEFKAAKEMQTVLMRQKAELEEMLARARGTDFYKPDVSCVSVGTRVVLKSTTDGKQETFTILGAWDSDPEKGIISYQTALASALLGKKVGEEADLPGDSGTRRIIILEIAAAIVEGESDNRSPETLQQVNA
jgi:transcription elongation GreA/GreB family factor